MENKDLLTEQELHELGLQALTPWLEQHNFKIDYMQTDMNTVPHIFALSGKILTVIVAATAMYPHKGVVGDAAGRSVCDGFYRSCERGRSA